MDRFRIEAGAPMKVMRDKDGALLIDFAGFQLMGIEEVGTVRCRLAPRRDESPLRDSFGYPKYSGYARGNRSIAICAVISRNTRRMDRSSW